jgi:hypothetical protein
VQGATAVDFEVMRMLSSWATLQQRQQPAAASQLLQQTSPPDEGGDAAAGQQVLPLPERIALGRMCKALLDEGRARHLAQAQFWTPSAGTACTTNDVTAAAVAAAADAPSSWRLPPRVLRYCLTSLTPENRLLLAVKRAAAGPPVG